MIVLYLVVAFILGFVAGGWMRDSKFRETWNEGHAAGIRDERAERLADALWHADNDSYGGSE